MVDPQRGSRGSASIRFTRRIILAAGPASLLVGTLGAARVDGVTMHFLQEWGKKGNAPGEFDAPIGLAIDDKDEILVSEFRNNRVQRFSAEGRTLSSFTVEPMPGGIAVDRQGRIYVAPMMSHKVCVYSPAGRLLHEWGKHGKGDGEFDQPGGIAVAPDGTVYVADQVNRRVQRFSPEGKFLLKWGEYGTRPGQFDGKEKLPNRTGGPNFVAVDANGYVYTTEAALGRVQKFTPDGKPVSCVRRQRHRPGGLRRPAQEPAGADRNLRGSRGADLGQLDESSRTGVFTRRQVPRRRPRPRAGRRTGQVPHAPRAGPRQSGASLRRRFSESPDPEVRRVNCRSKPWS